jgi:heat shock protein HtpX
MEISANENVTSSLRATLTFLAMSAILSLLGWAVAGGMGLLWILFMGILLVVLCARFPTSTMLRIYGAAPLPASQFPDLRRAVELLAARANLPVVPGLFCVRSSDPNAFAIGSKRQPAVVVTDGLLLKLNIREIVAVIAHEISHIKRDDVWLLRLVDILNRITGWLSIVGQLLVVINLPLFLLGGRTIPWLAIILLIVSPMLTKLLHLALSRSREFEADLDGISMSGDPLGLVSALMKMSKEKTIATGGVSGGPSQSSIWRTHPHTDERVDRILSLLNQQEIYGKASGVYHLKPKRRWADWCPDTGC